MQSVTPTQQEIKSRHYIQNLIEEGEHVHQDFKYQISDARKIARSISAFANNDGGHLLIGVKDNGKIAGVQSDEEIYMIEQAASMYCKPEQTAHFSVYRIQHYRQNPPTLFQSVGLNFSFLIVRFATTS